MNTDKALTVARDYIVTTNTGTAWSWNRAEFLIILLRTGIQIGKIQHHARVEADTVESGEAVVGFDGHVRDNYERVVFRDLGLRLKGLAAKVRGTFSLSKTNTRRIQPWRSETCPTTYLNLDTMAKLVGLEVLEKSVLLGEYDASLNGDSYEFYLVALEKAA